MSTTYIKVYFLLITLSNPVQVFVSVSGVGYYAPDPVKEYDEDGAKASLHLIIM